MELSEVLKVFAGSNRPPSADQCEVVTLTCDENSKHEKQSTTMSAASESICSTAVAPAAHHSTETSRSTIVHGSHHGILQGCSQGDDGPGCGSSIPGGPGAELCQPRSSSDSTSSRGHLSSSMGSRTFSRGQVHREDFQGSLRRGHQVLCLHEESHPVDQCLGSELPELCEGNAPEQASNATATDDQGNVIGEGSRSSWSDHSSLDSEPGDRARDDDGSRRREGAAADGKDRHSAARTRSDAQEFQQLEGPDSVTPASKGWKSSSTKSTHDSFEIERCHHELEQLTAKIQRDLDVMLALTREDTAPRGKSTFPNFPAKPGKCKLDLLEIYCEPNSSLTEMALKMGLRARRFTKQDGDLSTPQGQQALWEILHTECPRDVWMSPECKLWCNFSRLNMCRSAGARERILSGREAEQTHLNLCREVYEYQVMGGNHFHMEQPRGSEVFEQSALEEVVQGTLRAEFDMCEVGKLRVPKGNNFLRKRTVVRTTSREFHESLTRDTARKDTTISRLKAPSGILGKPSICQSIQLVIPMVLQRMFVGICFEAKFLVNFHLSCLNSALSLWFPKSS